MEAQYAEQCKRQCYIELAEHGKSPVQHRVFFLQIQFADHQIEQQQQELAALHRKRDETVQEMQVIRERITRYQEETEFNNAMLLKITEETGVIKSKQERLIVMEEQNKLKKLEINRMLLNWKSEEELLIQMISEKEKALLEADGQVAKVRKREEELHQLLSDSRELDRKLTIYYQEYQKQYLHQKSRLDSLINITERYDGYSNAIRKVMEKKKEVPGILGVVADLVKVEKEYETAIETALSSSIQHIVTEQEDTAKNLIEYLKKNKYGRATFLPLTSIGEGRKPLQHRFLEETGFLGLASSLVVAEDKYKGLINHLLSHILVVDHMDHALALAKAHAYSLRIVTLEGEQLNPGGSISGGAYKNSSNLIGRKREAEELEREVSRLCNAVERIRKEQVSEEQKRGKLRQDIEILGHELQEKYVVQNTAKLELLQEMENQKRLKDSYSKTEQEMVDLTIQYKSLQTQAEEFGRVYEENQIRKKETESRAAAAFHVLEKEKVIEAKQGEQETKIRLAAANAEQKIQFATEQLQRLCGEQERLHAQEQETESYYWQCIEERTKKEEASKLLKQDQKRRGSELLKLIQSLEEHSKKREQCSERHKAALDRREGHLAEKNDLDKEIYRLQAKLDRLLEQFNTSVTYLWEEYGLTLTTAKECFGVSDLSNNLKKEIMEQKLLIKQLGDVNVGAIEEYRTLSERFVFLGGQKEDLEEAEERLRQLITDLEREMQKQFLDQFAAIRTQFNQVFQALFGGGKAELLLMEEEDVLTAGVRIVVQPPGKKLQHMMQLSGGEKALTAISLLFAIQNLRPSPFCLLDEIEAALDDSNVDRFAGYLHKLTKNTQFIVITHRRGTMVASDRLYGITMQEKGVSTLVSVNLIEEELDK